MPELSRFLGIVIGMFYREHGVPHFHAVYGEHEISVEIETATKMLCNTATRIHDAEVKLLMRIFPEPRYQVQVQRQ